MLHSTNYIARMNMKILSEEDRIEHIEGKDKAIETMENLIRRLKAGEIFIKHCWLYQDYFDDDEMHNWFNIEWR
jgi:hypothetical protein